MTRARYDSAMRRHAVALLAALAVVLAGCQGPAADTPSGVVRTALARTASHRFIRPNAPAKSRVTAGSASGMGMILRLGRRRLRTPRLALQRGAESL